MIVDVPLLGARRNPSIVEMLRDNFIDSDNLELCGRPALLIVLMATYAQERLVSQQLVLRPRQSNSDTLQDSYSQISACSSTWSYEACGKAIESILDSYRHMHDISNQSFTILGSATKLSHVLSIIRFLPYRLMHIASGWMVQNNEAEVAAQKVAEIFETSPETTHRTFTHAARVFRHIRVQHQFDPFDPFIFLMAVLFIWFYDRFVVARRFQGAGWTTSSRTLRVDQEFNVTDREKLIEEMHQAHNQIHVSGIGTLNGNDSVPRILRESVRILNHDKAWSQQSAAMAQALQQILSGQNPSFSRSDE